MKIQSVFAIILRLVKKISHITVIINSDMTVMTDFAGGDDEMIIRMVLVTKKAKKKCGKAFKSKAKAMSKKKKIMVGKKKALQKKAKILKKKKDDLCFPKNT